jgi:hypothetical protein
LNATAAPTKSNTADDASAERAMTGHKSFSDIDFKMKKLTINA